MRLLRLPAEIATLVLKSRFYEIGQRQGAKKQDRGVLRRVGEGERVLITKRGKPWAVLAAVTEGSLRPAGLREYEVAWEDIEKTLKTSRPRYKT